MSITKLIILFFVILLFFAAVIFFQLNKGSIPSSKVTIKDQTFFVDVAQTPLALQKGLSTRKSLPQNQGMLFIFERPDIYSFWMKDMNFPIDIIFIKDDQIVSIAQNVQPPKSEKDTLPIYQPTGPSDKALEINAGLSKKYNFKTGDKIKMEFKQ